MPIDAALKLEIFNDTLVEHLGERAVTANENRESRLVLEQFWKDGRFIDECLEEGDWSFAIRTLEIQYDPALEPDYGFSRVFPKPDDCKRLVALSPDPDFNVRLDETGYRDENGYWFTYNDVIYASFISNLEEYGRDPSKWPEYFLDYMKARLARKACKRITQSDSRLEELMKTERRLLMNARGKDGMNKPSVKMNRGSWNKARNTSRLSRYGNW